MKLKNVEINKYIPMIISKFTYIDMQEQIVQGEKGTLEQCNLRRHIEKEYKELKEDHEQLIKFKDKQILGLEREIKKLDTKIKNDIPKDIARKINSQKGGYTKQINKLNNIILQFECENKALKEEIKLSEERNYNQAKKIKELLSGQKHIIEEYQQDGLPQSTKKALSNKEKRK